jgi:uncharacterized protein YhaN
MKITDIRIERFGAWRNLHLPLRPSGITVLYGPNEAGKTTLLRFIRGVLFGFRDTEAALRPRLAQDEDQAGALTIDFEGQTCELRRRAHCGWLAGNTHDHGPGGSARPGSFVAVDAAN